MENLIASIMVGLVICIIVTEFLRSYIFFSLFLGIPAGLITAFVLYIFFNSGIKKIEKN